MKIPTPVKHLYCSRCAMSINPLLSRYLWTGLGWRGQRVNNRSTEPRHTWAFVLCGPCAEVMLGELQSQGVREAASVVARRALADD